MDNTNQGAKKKDLKIAVKLLLEEKIEDYKKIIYENIEKGEIILNEYDYNREISKISKKQELFKNRDIKRL